MRYKPVGIVECSLHIAPLASHFTQRLYNSQQCWCDLLVLLQQLLFRICKPVAPCSWLRPVWTVPASHNQHLCCYESCMVPLRRFAKGKAWRLALEWVTSIWWSRVVDCNIYEVYTWIQQTFIPFLSVAAPCSSLLKAVTKMGVEGGPFGRLWYGGELQVGKE